MKTDQIEERIAEIEKKWSFAIVVSDMLDSIDFAIQNPPEYIILNVNDMVPDYVNFLGSDFNRGYPLQNQFGQAIQKFVIGKRYSSGREWIKDPENAVEDVAWGDERNKDYVYRAYLKYVYTDKTRAKIVETLQCLKKDIVEYLDLETELRRMRKAERDEAEQEFRVEILKSRKGTGGETGIDPYVKVLLTDSNGESRIYHCRNIFDFGFVVNRDGAGGGILMTTESGAVWNRAKMPPIPADNFDIRAVAYLCRFAPIEKHIRM